MRARQPQRVCVRITSEQGLQSLVFEAGPSNLRLPLVLQQFVDHDGVLSKVPPMSKLLLCCLPCMLESTHFQKFPRVRIPLVSGT